MSRLPAQSLAVVGAAHKNADGSRRDAEIEVCEPGEPVELVLEPENAHDPSAIAVFSARAVQIGYISAERAPRLGTLLGSEDVVAVFQRRTEFGAWIRLTFDGSEPALTPAMIEGTAEEPAPRRMEQEPDFYPDEVWPEEHFG